MIYAEDIGREIIKNYPCCEFWTIPFSLLPKREGAFFARFSPWAKTALVIGHHVTTKQEWTWYAKDKGSERCTADDRARDICEQLKKAFEVFGLRSEIVPYPEESGLQFRFVAQAAGAGEIGINAFLLHPLWGPWIHLRILATQAQTGARPILAAKVCNACGACIEACPAGAIKIDSFQGLSCRQYRKAKGEYVPFGPQQEFKYCQICADVCPIGEKPQNKEKKPG
jgi:epoxyqueuosine reductase QueG